MVKALVKIPRPKGNRPIAVRLKWNGRLEIEHDGDTGMSSSTVPLIESTHYGEDFVMGINARYVADAVAEGEGTVTARFTDPLAPVRLDITSDSVAVVMPLRL